MAAEIAKAIPEIGRAFAQCKPQTIAGKQAEPCVLHFDRVPREKHVEVARAIERLGYRVVGGGISSKGPKKMAADIQFVRR